MAAITKTHPVLPSAREGNSLRKKVFLKEQILFFLQLIFCPFCMASTNSYSQYRRLGSYRK